MVKIKFEISAIIEGPVEEIYDGIGNPMQVTDKPELADVLRVLGELAFVAETVAHLRGHEELLVTTDKARKMIRELQPREQA